MLCPLSYKAGDDVTHFIGADGFTGTCQIGGAVTLFQRLVDCAFYGIRCFSGTQAVTQQQGGGQDLGDWVGDAFTRDVRCRTACGLV
ncbi:hypothetical protein D3C72_2023750 [compost metagenome]